MNRKVVCHCRAVVLVLALLPLGAGAASAQTPLTANTVALAPGGSRAEASVEQLAWLAGHWQGSALGGLAEEVWSPPLGGTMMGMFRLVRRDAVGFYEIFALVRDGRSLVINLKHFDPELHGWEEKDEVVSFPLISLEEREARFGGMTFRLLDADRLQVFVAIDGEGEAPQEAEFLYHRVGSQAHARWQERRASAGRDHEGSR